jgi:hypothetical protein
MVIKPNSQHFQSSILLIDLAPDLLGLPCRKPEHRLVDLKRSVGARVEIRSGLRVSSSGDAVPG